MVRLRSVRGAIAARKENKFETRRSQLVINDTIKETKLPLLGVGLNRIIETTIAVITVICGMIFCVLFSTQFISKYNECRNEFTYQLWDNAFPIKMLKNGMFEPNCGYDQIIRIDANGKNVEVIPSIIDKCTKLTSLQLENNNIKNLPCTLLEMKEIKSANFKGNAVAINLEIQGCMLKGKEFPSQFVCKYLHKDLEILKFPNQTSIERINGCIKKFTSLKSMILPYNTNLKSDGVPTEILKLYREKLKTFDITGNNNLFKLFSWRNKNINQNLHGNMTKFLVEFIRNASVLDLSGNNIFDNHLFFDLLYRMKKLEHLNMSFNAFESIKPPNAYYNTSADIWPNLKSIDLSSNPISRHISFTFAQFVEERQITVYLKHLKSYVALGWRAKGSDDEKYYNGSSIFPRSIVKQLVFMQFGHLDEFTNVKFTSEDLASICDLPLLTYIFIRGVSYNITYMPKSCGKLGTFFLRAGDSSGKTNQFFEWPKAWSYSQTLTYLEISLRSKKIRFDSIPAFTNASIIRQLALNYMPVKSKLPNWLFDGRLKALRNVHFGNNKFYGNLAHSYFSSTSAIIMLQLHNNSLSGTIPVSVFNMPCLRVIRLDGNKFHGRLPNITEERTQRIRFISVERNDGLEEIQSNNSSFLKIHGAFKFSKRTEKNEVNVTLVNLTKHCTHTIKDQNESTNSYGSTIDTKTFELIQVYRCGKMNCYTGRAWSHVECIHIKYKILMNRVERHGLIKNLRRFVTVEAAVSRNTTLCADPKINEEQFFKDFLPSFLAGGCAGICEIAVTYPLEFLKVNTQLGISNNNVHVKKENVKHNSVKNNHLKRVLNIVYNRCKQQGYIRTLYTGSPAWFAFAFPRSAIRFSSFEFFSKQFQNKNSNSTQIMCGAFSGLIESVTCLTPQNNASVKLSQLKMSNTNLNAGFFQSMKICYKKVGFQGFVLPGLFATAIKNTTNYAIRFTVFNSLKQYFRNQLNIGNGEKIPFQFVVLSGNIAGGVSAIVTQPIDTLRTNQMALSVGIKRVSLFKTAKHVISAQNGNIFALYRGLTPRLGRVMIEMGLLFSLYEKFVEIIEEKI
eukprot:g3909.t1